MRNLNTNNRKVYQLLNEMLTGYPEGIRSVKSDDTISFMVSDFFDLIQLNNRNFSIDFEDQEFYDWLTGDNSQLTFKFSVNELQLSFFKDGNFLQINNLN